MWKMSSEKLSLTYNEHKTPKVFFTLEVLRKIHQIVEQTPIEVAFLGMVRDLGGLKYLVNEVFVPLQEANSATCEINAEGHEKYFNEILAADNNNADLRLNHIKFWGHSHVNMGIGPSSQDKEQLREFASSFPASDLSAFYIAGIFNKKGEINLDIIYPNPFGMVFNKVPWEIYIENDESIAEQVKQELEENLHAKAVTTVKTSYEYKQNNYSSKFNQPVKNNLAPYNRNYNYNYNEINSAYDYDDDDWAGAPPKDNAPVKKKENVTS